MKRGLIYVLLFAYGILGGAFFCLNKAGASTPVSEASGGEATASVVFDEYWVANSALEAVSAGGGAVKWAAFNNFPNDSTPSDNAKMIVTKWIVHGHIHQR